MITQQTTAKLNDETAIVEIFEEKTKKRNLSEAESLITSMKECPIDGKRAIT